MSLLSTPPIDALTPEELWATNAETPSTLGQYTGESFMDTLKTSIFGVGTQVGPDYQPPMSGGIFGQPAVQQPSGTKALTEDEWKASKHYVPDIPYDPTMTEAKANFLKQQYDTRRWRDSVYERYQGGLGGKALGIAAMLAGGALAPENYIPILGPVSRAYMATRLGRVGAHVAAGSAEGVIGNLAVAPYVYQGLAAQGEDVGIEDVALDLAFGAILGGAFGGGMGVLADRGARARAMREAAISGRANAMNTAADALNLAADAVERGDAPDVARIVQPEMERARGVVERMPGEESPTTIRQVGSGGTTPVWRPLAAGEPVPENVQTRVDPETGATQVLAEPPPFVARATEPVDGTDAEAGIAVAGRSVKEPGDVAGQSQQPWLLENIDRHWATATRLDVVGDIERMAADGMTATQTASALGERLKIYDDMAKANGELPQQARQDKATLVRVVRNKLGVPSMDEAAAYSKWRDDYRAGKRASAEPARALDPRPIEPDPIPESVTTAAPRVGKSGDELQEFVEDLGLEDMSTIDMDLNELRRAGAITAADELALEAAAAEAKVANDVATAYESLATCVVRYGT